jgi:hypothetical protein
MRLFVIEGLGGRGHSMEQFYRANERQRPNDHQFKMIYNPQVRFTSRKYLDFNCSMRKLKLMDTLTNIMVGPDIYLRNKST